ncbi:helix-turn-helix domain-containing protein [Streptosporangium sp. NPDC087985]|uniref:helix-turn-helix domain-containing protein n=1 Tax=Streptosporangium sp. NPDC087985 TaxID=3366196 RepID=UPI0037FF6DD0
MDTREGQQQKQHDHDPPGLRLWERAEQVRLARGWSKTELAERMGMGRVTYDRLRTQENKPQAKTVRRVADAIGISHTEAGVLAGLIEQPASRMEQVLTDAIAGHLRGVPSEAERHVRALREAGQESGKTLGDVLVLAGLAEPDELKVTRKDPVVEELEDDPELPDDIKKEFLDGYRRLRAEVAARVRECHTD